MDNSDPAEPEGPQPEAEQDTEDLLDEVTLPIFDPDSEQFADVPLVDFRPDGPHLVRRQVPHWIDLEDMSEHYTGIHGVWWNDLRTVVLVPPGRPFASIARHDLIDVGIPLAAATSLDDAIAALRQAIARMEEVKAAGWRLKYAEETYLAVRPDDDLQ